MTKNPTDLEIVKYISNKKELIPQILKTVYLSGENGILISELAKKIDMPPNWAQNDVYTICVDQFQENKLTLSNATSDRQRPKMNSVQRKSFEAEFK